jgi:hypothetical protein
MKMADGLTLARAKPAIRSVLTNHLTGTMSTLCSWGTSPSDKFGHINAFISHVFGAFILVLTRSYRWPMTRSVSSELSLNIRHRSCRLGCRWRIDLG